MKKIVWVFVSALMATAAAQNPLVSPGIYMADPAARYWNSDRMYLYCSVDESTRYYCSHHYHVLSSDDMKRWSLHENRFSSRGNGDEVSYNDKLLFAPDCMEKEGTYYLYYCQPDQHQAEGVAVGDHPAGPFRDGKLMDVGEYGEIDPGVFRDDDGQVYYVWGQFSLKMARMNPDMQSIDLTSIRDDVLTEEEHFFHEGAYMTRREGLYYLVYADMSRGGTPTCLGYATSKDPMGPYTYRGVIIDNDHCDPAVWNNHGSIASLNGQWYVFYHRSTHNSRKMRKPCAEPISFREDGTIPEVEMTTQGAGAPLNAFRLLDASRVCQMFGNVRIEKVGPSEEALCKTHHNDRAVLRYVDFGDSAPDSVSIRVRSGSAGGSIVLRAGYPWKSPIASLEIPAGRPQTAGEWITLTSPVKKIVGVHALWINFYSNTGNESFGCSLTSLQFR